MLLIWASVKSNTLMRFILGLRAIFNRSLSKHIKPIGDLTYKLQFLVLPEQVFIF